MTLREFIEKKMRENPSVEVFFDGRLPIINVYDAVDISYGIMRDMGIKDNDFEIEIKADDENKTD